MFYVEWNLLIKYSLSYHVQLFYEYVYEYVLIDNGME